MFKFYLINNKDKDKKNKEITDYVINASWSGETNTVSRKLDFSIAYSTKDKAFINVQINCGDNIKMQYIDDKKNTYNIFDGIVFNKNRNTSSITMEFNCFDKLIYLNKRKNTKKFDNITAIAAIKQVCNENNTDIGKYDISLNSVFINLIENEKTYAEMIMDILNTAATQTGKSYSYYCNDNKINIVIHDEVVEKFVLSDEVNIISTNHSESIEDMINTVIIMDKDGNETGRIVNSDDIKTYNIMSDIYKIDEKQDTQIAAKSKLKSIAYKSNLSAIGNIQCIAGYAVQIQEEQLKGLFAIISDRHTIQDNKYTMDLDLIYLEEAAAK